MHTLWPDWELLMPTLVYRHFISNLISLQQQEGMALTFSVKLEMLSSAFNGYLLWNVTMTLTTTLTASAKLHGSSMTSWWSCTATWRRCIRTCWSTLLLILRRLLWRSCSLISATSVQCSLWVHGAILHFILIFLISCVELETFAYWIMFWLFIKPVLLLNPHRD